MGRRKLPVPQPKLYKDPRGLWQVTWTDPVSGKTVRRGCSTRKRKEAEAMMPRIVADGFNPSAPASFTIGELIDAYVKERIQEEHSRTFEHNFRPLRSFFGSLKPAQLKDATFRQYRQQRTQQTKRNAGTLAAKSKNEKSVSDSTAIRELNALRGAISWGRRNGWSELANVSVHVPQTESRVRYRFLTQAEAKRLIAACIEPHTALFVRISIATGARMSAVLELKWDDVTFPGTSKGEMPSDTSDLVAVNVTDVPDVQFVDPKTGEHHFLDGFDFDLRLAAPITFDLGRGRGNKRRGIGVISPSNMGLYDALVKAFERHKSEFVIEWRGKGVRKVDLTDAYRRAGIAGATQHTLKHTCCSWLVQAGQSYESIAKLVGTSAKTIEKHYGHLSPKHLATVGSVLTLD